MAAIFDLPLTPMSESVRTSSTVLVNLENVGVAFGILLLCLVYKLRYNYFKLNGRHLGFLTSAYLLTSDYHLQNTRGMSAPKNMGAAVGILLLTSVELHVISRSQVEVTTSGFEPPYWLSGWC